ncbi:hypothetical protein AMTR_s00144p00094560 [Amborella trichopoda]|uniref:Uncharacterized protein n=1 Tax=Amborella trichopoda TaxID=13333 RepID=W1P6Z6_AMBTC|nr:hypothetical protein AMTR_s00144p00094560 [Amborella trichopoda]
MSSNVEQPKLMRTDEQERSGPMANWASGPANPGVGGQQAMCGEANRGGGQHVSGGDGRQPTEGLPLESSPYVKHSNLEDYKRHGYGTDGQHLEPVNNQRGRGATDGPTLSGQWPQSSSG